MIADTTQLATLPALRSLGDLADLRPTVVVDTREQQPLPIARLNVVAGTLTTGDYSFAGGEHLFSVERKSIADLTACCRAPSRARFERELLRLRGYHFKRLLIVGTREDIEGHAYRSNVSPQATLASLAAFEVRYDVPVVFEPTPEAAAARVECWVWWAAREMIVNVNAVRRGIGDPATRPPGTPSAQSNSRTSFGVEN